MKTMKKFLSMAALAMVGAMITGCSNEDDSIIDTTQQPEVIKSNVVTMTTTVGLDGAAATRALTSTGVKTFAENDKIAVVYENTGGTMVKAESEALTPGNISADGKSATFTVTLTDAKASGTVKYIYPAAMAGATDVNYTKLNSQDGTLDNLGKNLDLAIYDGNLTAEAKLPASATLENKLAILAITLKNEAGTSDITGSTTKLTVSDGTNTYNVMRSAVAGPIYVAIRPTTSATINIEAISGGNGYCKTLTTKTYAASNGYPVSWKMTPAKLLSTIASSYTAQNGETLYGKLGSNVKISIADGATVTLKDVTINGTNDDSYDWAGITCEGNATIILEGTNSVKGFYYDYPGIYVPENKTLTIQGTGSLTASSNGYGAGIGGGNAISCGNIEIKGGEITAGDGSSNSGSAGIGGGGSASCGNITISGGTVTANGGDYGAGIGCGYSYNGLDTKCGDILISGGTVTATGGYNAAGIGGGSNDGFDTFCGTITINNTVTKLTATKGSGAVNSIGPAGIDWYVEYCGTVKIGGTEYWDGDDNDYKNGGDTYLTQDQIIYPAP